MLWYIQIHYKYICRQVDKKLVYAMQENAQSLPNSAAANDSFPGGGFFAKIVLQRFLLQLCQPVFIMGDQRSGVLPGITATRRIGYDILY